MHVRTQQQHAPAGERRGQFRHGGDAFANALHPAGAGVQEEGHIGPDCRRTGRQCGVGQRPGQPVVEPAQQGCRVGRAAAKTGAARRAWARVSVFCPGSRDGSSQWTMRRPSVRGVRMSSSCGSARGQNRESMRCMPSGRTPVMRSPRLILQPERRVWEVMLCLQNAGGRYGWDGAPPQGSGLHGACLCAARAWPGGRRGREFRGRSRKTAPFVCPGGRPVVTVFFEAEQSSCQACASWAQAACRMPACARPAFRVMQGRAHGGMTLPGGTPATCFYLFPCQVRERPQRAGRTLERVPSRPFTDFVHRAAGGA